MAENAKFDAANDEWTDISSAGTLTNFHIQNQSNDVLLVVATPDATPPADLEAAIKFFQSDKLYPLTVDGGYVWVRSGGADACRVVVLGY